VSLERLLTARELADLVGFSAATIVDWSERGELPSFKVGGRLRFRESEVEAWIEARRTRGDVSPAPSNPPSLGVVSQASPAPSDRRR
jgi:excisionase family DNA binding protein